VVVGSEVGWVSRALVYVDERLEVRTPTGRGVSESLPELIGLVDALDRRTAILDCELVACPDGQPEFYALGPRMAHTGRHARWVAAETPVTFVAFDLLCLDGEDLCARPWSTQGAARRSPPGPPDVGDQRVVLRRRHPVRRVRRPRPRGRRR
jgi:bifunctional non-homologous end joining protein LigD